MQSQNQNIVMYKNIQNTRLMSNPQHPEKKEKINDYICGQEMTIQN